MRRRVLRVTVSAVALAVLLLGLPLAVAGALLVRDEALQEAQRRAASLARSVERRLDSGAEVERELLDSATGGDDGELPATVRVTLPGGEQLRAGPAEERAAYRATTTTDDGATVEVAVPSSAVRGRSWTVVGIVVAVASVALAAAVALALVLAQRLAEPLTQLARGAQRLGSGETRLRHEPSGIDEVDLLAAELARGADRVAARLAAEREFASDASHQLRTPLTALSMRLEEIAAASDAPEVRQEAQVALDQVERLVSVVDDLMQRARRGTEDPLTLVALDDVLTQQRQEWQPSFAAAGRVLDVVEGTGLRVRASPGRLGQVLATLLENSLVHGAGTTTVRARRSATNLVVEVSDEGPGVPASLGSRVFERSVSGRSSTGLGLAVARDLVSADGGRLELLSTRPAVFGIFLSLAEPGEPSAEPAPVAPADVTGRR